MNCYSEELYGNWLSLPASTAAAEPFYLALDPSVSCISQFDELHSVQTASCSCWGHTELCGMVTVVGMGPGC